MQTLLTPRAARPAPRRLRLTAAASAAASRAVPDMDKRNFMNLLLVGAIALPGLPLAGGFLYFLVPPPCVRPLARAQAGWLTRARRPPGGGGGTAAKDALGDVVKKAKWLSTHLAGDRELTQGLKARCGAALAPAAGARRTGNGSTEMIAHVTRAPRGCRAPPPPGCTAAALF